MSRKTNIKKLKRGARRNSTQKMKASVGGAAAALNTTATLNTTTTNHMHDNNSPLNFYNNESREYTVFLLETSHIRPNIIDRNKLNKIQEKIKKKIQEKIQNGENEEKNIKILQKFEMYGIQIIKSGLHDKVESINSSVFRRKTSEKKYLGIVLDLTHFVKETSLDESEIITIFRETIMNRTQL